MSVFEHIQSMPGLPRFRLACAWLLLSSAMTGCAGLSAFSGSGKKEWLDSGSLAISRPLPAPKATAARARLKSFESPTLDDSAASTSIIISRKDRTLTAIRPGQPPLVFTTQGTDRLKSGSYSVTLKEENPLWYAPAAYFSNRSLRTPAEGSRERFKRGALGTKSLYLNDRTPIHSGPVWIPEIGGVRLPHEQMAQIFATIEVGTRVEVR